MNRTATTTMTSTQAGESDPSDQNLLTLGLRFTGIEVPQGTTIDSAFVVFHAHEGKTAADVAMLTIVGEATDNATTFDEASGFNENYLLTDRIGSGTTLSH